MDEAVVGESQLGSETPKSSESVDVLRESFDRERSFGDGIVSFARDRDYAGLTPYVDSSSFLPEQVLAVGQRRSDELITDEDVAAASDASLALGVDVILQVGSETPMGRGLVEELDSLDKLYSILQKSETKAVEALANGPDTNVQLIRSTAARVLGIDENRVPATKEELREWILDWGHHSVDKIGRAYEALENYMKR